MTFFLVIDQVFRIFPLVSLIFRIFTLLDIVHNPFLATKTSFSHFASKIFFLSHPINNTSQNIGGTNAWAVPPPQTLGGPSPSPPRFPPLSSLLLISQ